MQAWRSNPAQQEHLRECIKTAIRFLFIDSFEVPVLAMFYKEYMGELLSLRRGDEPGLLPVSPRIHRHAHIPGLLSLIHKRNECISWALTRAHIPI